MSRSRPQEPSQVLPSNLGMRQRHRDTKKKGPSGEQGGHRPVFEQLSSVAPSASRAVAQASITYASCLGGRGGQLFGGATAATPPSVPTSLSRTVAIGPAGSTGPVRNACSPGQCQGYSYSGGESPRAWRQFEANTVSSRRASSLRRPLAHSKVATPRKEVPPAFTQGRLLTL